MIKEKLVLAYSGGLDTSYSLKKLSQENYEVHAVSVNTGGFSKQEIDTIEKKAYEIGPGKVLSGLIKRIDKSVKVNAINNEQDINNIEIND